MSEQNRAQSSTKRPRSHRKSKQNGTPQSTTPPRPTNDDKKEVWKAYWMQQDQSWRTEPEIDLERQKFLAQRLTIVPNIEHGIYPFKNIKLCRADVEWLLATLEDGRGPIYLSGESNRIHQGLDLRGADLRQANLRRLPLAFTRGGLFLDEWLNATEEQRNMAAVLMSESDLSGVHLERAILRGAHLENASLREANLEGSILAEAYLNRTALLGASLSDQRHIGPVVADTNWGNVNLAVVKWSSMKMLSDEYEALQKEHDGKIKDKVTRLDENEKAVRANRQLAVALEAQGLNEDAARFAYRAQKLQRIVLRRQRNFGSYLFSCFLDLLVGYGYRPRRSLLWYLVTVFVFAVAYFAFGHLPLFPDSLVLSLTSFHGRGFFPGLGNEITLHNPLVVLAAFEAVIGLLIEISFIATFTQRFLGK